MAALSGSMCKTSTLSVCSWSLLVSFCFYLASLRVKRHVGFFILQTWFDHNIYIGSSAKTISFLVTASILLLAYGVNESFTIRSPIIPPRLFKVGMLPVKLFSFLMYPSSDKDYQYYLDHDFLSCIHLLRWYILPSTILPSTRCLCHHGWCMVTTHDQKMFRDT